MIEEKLHFQGYLSVYDENGNHLFTEKNMIVKTGRNAIFNSAFSGSSISFTKILLGNRTILTDEDTTAPSGTTLIATIDSDIEVTSDSTNLIKTISFEKEYSSSDNPGSLREVNFMIDGDILFSRVLLPPYPFSSGKTYTFNYKIYF